MAYNSSEMDVWTPGLTEKVIISVVFGSVILVGTIGNILILALIILVRKLHSVVNLCFASLALADLLVLAISPIVPLTSLNGVDNSVVWKNCGIYMLMLIAPPTCSMLTFLLISVERYTVVIHPLKSIGMWTYKKVGLLLAIIWVVSTGVCVPSSYLVRYGERHLDNETTALGYCYFEDSSGWLETYESTVALITFFLPVPILVFLYVKMICALKQRVKQDDTQGNAVRKAQKSRTHVVWMLVVLLVIFVTCLLPNRIYILLDWYAPDVLLSMESRLLQALWWFCNIMLDVNYAANPVVYFLMSDNFRDPIKAVSCKKPFKRKRTGAISTADHVEFCSL